MPIALFACTSWTQEKIAYLQEIEVSSLPLFHSAECETHPEACSSSLDQTEACAPHRNCRTNVRNGFLICLSRITKISTGMCVFRVCLLLTGHSRWPPAPCWLTMRFHPDLPRSYFPRGVTSGIDGRLTCPEAEKSSDPTAFCAEETTFFSLQGFFPRFSHLALRTRSQISLAIFCSLFAMAAGNE